MTAAHAGTLRGKKVLLLAGSDCVARATERALNLDGAQVWHCDCEEAARQCMTQTAPEIAILDTATPDCSAWSLCASLRLASGNDGLRILFVHRSGKPVERRRANLLGANAFLAKPFRRSDLKAALTPCLEPCNGG